MTIFHKAWGVLAAAALVISGCSEAPVENAEEIGTTSGKFLHISDIHFDPTADGVGQQLAKADVSGGFTPAKLGSIASSIQTGTGQAYDSFTDYYKARPGMPSNWRYYACATDDFDDSEFMKCSSGN